MEHENDSKQSEAGKADLEKFDVLEAIAEVRRLGEGLMPATAHAKHHFRREWLEQLVQRYTERPGKPVIHLDDLNDAVIPHLAAEARPFLRPYWLALASKYGSDRMGMKFRCLRDIVVAGKASRWSNLASWRKLSELTGLRVNELEPFVVTIRVSRGSKSKLIQRPKLPFNLATPSGAKIFGYRGDAAYRTSAFLNKKSVLHEDYKRAITETIGEVPFTTTVRKTDRVKRSNVGTFVTLLTSIAGLDNTKRQKLAANPIPSWFFKVNDDVVVTGLRALWVAEGSPTKTALQLGQAIGFSIVETNVNVPMSPIKSPISILEESSYQQILLRPPLLLVSLEALLYRLGIMSYVAPQKIWRNRTTGYTIFWNLSIYRMQNMRLFRDKIGFLSPNKKAKLKAFTKAKRSSSLPPIFSSGE
jgi:hypothetical protein